jgi:hypothetical protein
MAFVMSSMTLSLFRITPEEFAVAVDRAPDLTPGERARQKETFEEYTNALLAAKRRVVPLAVAELILGASMIVFAQRAATGRSWARNALIQLTIAHVGLTVVEWLLTPQLRGPEEHFEIAYNNFDRTERSDVPEGASKLVRLGLGAAASGIAILGLTLPRSRAFYTLADELRERQA